MGLRPGPGPGLWPANSFNELGFESPADSNKGGADGVPGLLVALRPPTTAWECASYFFCA